MVADDRSQSFRDPDTDELPWIIRYVSWVNRSRHLGYPDGERPVGAAWRTERHPGSGSISTPGSRSAARPNPAARRSAVRNPDLLARAARCADAAYPGAVGQLLRRELQAAADDALRFGGGSTREALMWRVADEIDPPPRRDRGT